MDKFFNITQIVLSILLIASILLQHRGTGIGGAFGGAEGNVYRSRRGIEKTLFNVTIILVALFLITSLLNIVY